MFHETTASGIEKITGKRKYLQEKKNQGRKINVSSLVCTGIIPSIVLITCSAMSSTSHSITEQWL